MRGNRANLRVLHVAPCFIDLDHEAGGVANVVRQLATRQSQRGVDVTIFCGTTELGCSVAQPDFHEVNDRLRRRSFAQYSVPELGPVAELRKTIAAATDAFDIAHVHTCFSRFTEAAMRELSMRNIPFVFTPHGKLSPGMRAQRAVAKQLWWLMLARGAVERAARVFALAVAERDAIVDAGITVPVEIIPNGFDRGDAPLDLPTPIQSPYILYLGYLDPRKQPGLLIQAFAASQARHTHSLALVGPDKYGHGSELRGLAQRCGIADRVVFAGPAYGVRKWEFLQNASCLCLPSLAEGLPVVLCEALGAGLPAVYSRPCNFPEIGAAGAGIEIDGFEPAAWAGAIDAVVNSEAARAELARRALQLGERYSWDFVVGRTLESYRESLR